MVCDGQKLKVYNHIKDRKVKKDSIPLMSGTFDINKWYRTSDDKSFLYLFTTDAANYLSITYNGTIFPTRDCFNNPVSDCECIIIGGTVLDSQIDSALSALPLESKSSNTLLYVGIVAAVVVVGVLLTRKKK